jgi:histo-blood group ABO system transferase
MSSRLRVALVTVASGERYVQYAEQMLSSAKKYFFADSGAGLDLVMLAGREGWPAATMERYHVIVENAERLAGATHVFHVDADMRFVAPVGAEIIAPLVGTTHPGYVGRRGPYEARPESAACVAPDEGSVYYCGGIVGGERTEFLQLANAIRAQVDRDAEHGIVARWHDESHLNRYLIDRPPDLALSPSYCYPEDARNYIRRVWPERYEPKLIALDKPRRVQWTHRLTRLRRRPAA